MKHATSRELYSYWRRLRGERAAPERADIDPSQIRNILADTFILETEALESPVIRVIGARANALFGHELKGTPFLSLWRPEDQPVIQTLIEGALDETSAVVAGASTCPRGRIRVELELLLLPLRHHGRTHVRLMGALSPASIPSWLGLIAAEPMTLTSTRVIGAGEGRIRSEPVLQAIPKPASEWARTEPTRRGHLLVHDGGR